MVVKLVAISGNCFPVAFAVNVAVDSGSPLTEIPKRF